MSEFLAACHDRPKVQPPVAQIGKLLEDVT